MSADIITATATIPSNIESGTSAARLRDYLRLFAGGAVEGYIAGFELSPPRHIGFSVTDIDAAATELLAQSSAGKDVYIRTNLQSTFAGAKEGGVSRMTVVTIDFDLQGAGHKQTSLPAHPEDFQRLLDAANIPPATVVLFTGGGLLGVWALENPIDIDSDGDLARAKSLSRSFQLHLRDVALQQFGWKLDSTSDLVRACRLPGTRNWKPAYVTGPTVEVVEWGGVCLSNERLEEIANRCGGQTVDPQPPGAGASTPKRKPTEPTANWSSIYNGCDALREWADTKDGLAELHWYAEASVLAACVSGREIFHSLSKADHRYSPAEADSKFSQAATNSAPRTCSNIADIGGSCSQCPFRGRVQSPMSLNHYEPAAVRLARGWIYVASIDAFIDLNELENR